MAEIASVRTSYPVTSDLDSDNEEVEDDELDNTNIVPVFANTVFYQRVTYFEHNKAGITVYGFTLDNLAPYDSCSSAYSYAVDIY